ncbi:MAG: FAD-binding protein [Agitococcus sp.]|nr:FAD-binding protein [Agitococcus sp.]MDO9178684.1 FAD-binding protein [Agitococcus sp.]
MRQTFITHAASIQGVIALTSDQTLVEYGADTGAANRAAHYALKITDANAIVSLIKLANCPLYQNQISFWPISGGRNFGYGTAQPVDARSIILDLSALKKITLDLRTQTACIEPGVTQSDLANAVASAKANLLVPVTGAGPHGTILGNALDGGYGLTPFMDHFNAVSVWEGVWGNGTSFGHVYNDMRCEAMAKGWAAGTGPSPASLLRQGNFGIVTRATVQLARAPESTRLVVFVWHSDAEFEESQDALSRLIEELPNLTGVIMMNARRMLATKKRGTLAHAPSLADDRDVYLNREIEQQRIAPWSGLGTVFGARSVVSSVIKDLKRRLPLCQVLSFSPERIDTLKTIASLIPTRYFSVIQQQIESLGDALSMLEGRPNSNFLQLAYAINKVTVAGADANPAKDGQGILWYAPLVPFNIRDVRQFRKIMSISLLAHGFDPLLALTTRSSRVLSAPIPILFDKSDPADVLRAKECYRYLVDIGLRFGWPPYRIGIEYMDQLGLPAGCPTVKTHQSLKSVLDPHDVVAPGRYTFTK